jgi:hypothetical protein
VLDADTVTARDDALLIVDVDATWMNGGPRPLCRSSRSSPVRARSETVSTRSLHALAASPRLTPATVALGCMPLAL